MLNMLAIAGDQLENKTSSTPGGPVPVSIGPSHALTDSLLYSYVAI